MIIMMVMLPASVLVTVGVATKVTGTAAVVGVIEDAGKTPMSKMEYNCLTPVVIVVVGFGTSPIIEQSCLTSCFIFSILKHLDVPLP